MTDLDAAAPGHLVNGNGTSVLAQAPQGPRHEHGATRILRSPTSRATPLPLLSYAAEITNDVVALQFQQPIAADDALRSGAYSKTLTFTLSTTAP